MSTQLGNTAKVEHVETAKHDKYALRGLILTCFTDIAFFVYGFVFSYIIDPNSSTLFTAIFIGFFLLIFLPLKTISIVLCLMGLKSQKRHFAYIGLGIFCLETLLMAIFLEPLGPIVSLLFVYMMLRALIFFGICFLIYKLCQTALQKRKQ